MKPLEAKQMGDYIVNVLVEQIMSGNLADGTRITQEEVAKKTQLSRMPVREALQALEQEGFLKRLPTRHMEVIGVSQRTIQSTFRILGAIELEAASLLYESDFEVTYLQRILKSMDTEKPKAELDQNEIQFHFELIKGIRNSYVENIQGKFLKGYLQYGIRNFTRPSEKVLPLLREILRGIEKKERAVVQGAISAYYGGIIDAMIEGGNYE